MEKITYPQLSLYTVYPSTKFKVRNFVGLKHIWG